MSELEGVSVALALGGGVVLGALYVLALWRTVLWATRRGRHGDSYTAGLMASFAARVVAVAGGLTLAWYLTPAAGVAAFAGFLGARSLATRRICERSEGSWN
jgi:ABC-type sulfate transport system permease component